MTVEYTSEDLETLADTAREAILASGAYCSDTHAGVVTKVDVFYAAELTPIGELERLLLAVKPSVIFLDRADFIAAELLPDDLDEVPPAMLRFLQSASKRDGELSTVYVRWNMDGLHCVWSATAAWVDDLTTRAEALVAGEAEAAEQDRVDEDRNRRAAYTRIRETILAAPEYRSAGTQQRKAVAQSLAEKLVSQGITQGTSVNMYWILSYVYQDAAAELHERTEDVESRLDELAGELRETEEWKAARTQAVKSEVAAEFVMNHSDGWRLAKKVSEALARRAAQR